MGKRASKPQTAKRRRKPGTQIATATKRPNDWDKAVSAAYLRLLGATQDQAGKEVGISMRSVAAWEASDWWPTAEAEAKSRWLKGGDAAAMSTLVAAMQSEKDAQTARWWAERRLDGFGPPKRQHEHSGRDGGPIPIAAAAMTPEQLANLTDKELDNLENISQKLLPNGDTEPE